MLQDLLTAALSHFRAFGNTTAAAQSMLGLAELQLLVNQPQLALEHVQQALKLPADIATRSKAVSLLAKVHDNMPSGENEAVQVLEEGVAMMQEIAR